MQCEINSLVVVKSALSLWREDTESWRILSLYSLYNSSSTKRYNLCLMGKFLINLPTRTINTKQMQ